MNKSNVSEIKQTMKITVDDIPSIDTLCTCFVNGNKEKLISNTEKYRDLDEEEQKKYIDILSSALTGTIGKKLINLTFGLEPEAQAAQKGMGHTVTNMFQDNAVRDSFFDKIIKSYDFNENYLIVTGKGIYDVPMKASDGVILEDETDTYEFMITAICPVHSTKAGLTLDPESGRMVSSKQVQIVQSPINGFLYPAFNDRQSDLSGMLYFTKKPEECHSELIEELIGSKAPTTSKEQQDIFESIIAEVTNDKADFEIVKALHENLSQMTEEAKMNSEDKKLSKEDIKSILQDAGVDDTKLNDFDHIYKRAGGDETTDFIPQNLMEINKFNIKAPDVQIKIKPDKTGLVQKKKVDGKNCIVVTLEGDIELNGIQVSEV